jgi:hypothetical protein
MNKILDRHGSSFAWAIGFACVALWCDTPPLLTLLIAGLVLLNGCILDILYEWYVRPAVARWLEKRKAEMRRDA